MGNVYQSVFIAILTGALTYFLLKITSREKRDLPGDLVITLGAYQWTGLIFGLLLSGFMSIMLVKNGFKGPKGQEWVFWGIYILGILGTLFFALSALFANLFPVRVSGDVIHYTTSLFERRSNDISNIEQVYMDKFGSVNFMFDDGDKVSVSPFAGGGDAVLEHIYKRLEEKFAEDFLSHEDDTVH